MIGKLIAAFIVGANFGVLLTALCVAAGNHRRDDE